MSKETIEWLNSHTLIGMTDERGTAWHNDDRIMMWDGQPNNYSGAIPVADVERRLFHWTAIDAPLSVSIPADIETGTALDDNGLWVRSVKLPDRKAIVRSDTGEVMGVFKQGYQSHQVREWLLQNVSGILGDTLVVSSAGELRGGAQCWVEISVPETMHDARSGFDYRPNLLAATSFDGSIATTYGRTVTATVCDNTLAVARSEMGTQQVKIKHSSRSLSSEVRDKARAAFNFVEQVKDDFDAELEMLTTTTVTDVQWRKFLDLWVPIPADKGAKQTIAQNKQDQLRALWNHDQRVAPWAGTALGVLQAANTHLHHLSVVKGAARADRNISRGVSGEIEKFDSGVLDTLNKVLVASS